MDSQPLYKLWDDFLNEWPVNRVSQMTLEEYTNLNTNDAFIYWLEKKLEKLGSIWGGSAFKFGIYCRKDLTEKKSTSTGGNFGEKYGWHSKYGATEQEAFKTIKIRIVEVIKAIQEKNLDIIDTIDLSPTLKWKIAFLYQEQENPSIFTIFKKEALFYFYKSIDPTAKLSSTPYSLLYTTVFDKYRDKGNLFKMGDYLWEKWESSKDRKYTHWVIPLSWVFSDAEEINSFCLKEQIHSDDISSFLDKLLSDSELSEGDEIALLVGSDIKAVGTITNAESGEFSWDQIPVDFPSELIPLPTSEVKRLDAAEIKAIWDQVSTAHDKEPQKTITPIDVDLPEPESRTTSGEPCEPSSIILYGPPGTGKTYSTVDRALQIIIGENKVEAMSSESRMRLFRNFQQEGRIEFVTFHQSYGYEEFVEGIRPVLDNAESSEVKYELHAGVFKRIAFQAATEGLREKVESISFDKLWTQLVKDIKSEGERMALSSSGKSYLLEVTGGGSIGVYACDADSDGNMKRMKESGFTASKENTRLFWDNRKELGPEPEDITHDKTQTLFAKIRGGSGGHHYTAIWIAYSQILALSRSGARYSKELNDPVSRVQEVLDKKDAGLVDFSFSKSSPQYVLIIDEINRGNMSKILGELITLLEPEKRLGSINELKLPLSYSPDHKFAVPPNLHILGTMNTADRSIALMDVALRRRFTFEALMPESSVIRHVLAKEVADTDFIDLVVDLFEMLNKRIRFLYDNDHQIGHAYFLKINSYETLRLLFIDRIIPLLQEYFYGSWDKTCMVLGCPYDESGTPLRKMVMLDKKQYRAPLIKAVVFEELDALGFDHLEYEDRLDYKVDPQFRKAGQTPDKLIPYFLDILNHETAAYETRRGNLLAGASSFVENQEAVS